jgi:hypothetical protein
MHTHAHHGAVANLALEGGWGVEVFVVQKRVLIQRVCSMQIGAHTNGECTGFAELLLLCQT